MNNSDTGQTRDRNFRVITPIAAILLAASISAGIYFGVQTYHASVGAAKVSKVKVTQVISTIQSNNLFQKNISEAQTEESSGHLQPAADAAQKALKYASTNSEKATAYFWIGLVQNDQSNFTQSEASERTSIQLNSNYSDSHQVLADDLERAQNLSEAMQEANRAIQLDPANPWAYNVRAIIYADQGNKVSALGDVNKAISLNGNIAVFKKNKTAITNM